MGVHIGDHKLVVTKKMLTKDVNKNLKIKMLTRITTPKDVDKNLWHEIDSIIKLNELVAQHTIKNEISQLLFKYKHGNDIHEQ